MLVTNLTIILPKNKFVSTQTDKNLRFMTQNYANMTKWHILRLGIFIVSSYAKFFFIHLKFYENGKNYWH
jgi:hypothetical protein